MDTENLSMPHVGEVVNSMATNTTGFPRRIDSLRYTPAELAIAKAMEEVEKLPADARLTDAVILLSEAKNKVADYVDGV